MAIQVAQALNSRRAVARSAESSRAGVARRVLSAFALVALLPLLPLIVCMWAAKVLHDRSEPPKLRLASSHCPICGMQVRSQSNDDASGDFALSA